MSTSLDAIGFPTRGLAPDAVAERLAAWVRWPIERGSASDVERGGRQLRVHSLAVGGGARLVTVVETKKRYFLPAEEIVCFFPAFGGGAERELEIVDVQTATCPHEPFGSTVFPDRLRFRITNPFEREVAGGAKAVVALALLAGRLESAPPNARPMILASQFASQDLDLSPDLFTVAGPIESVSDFVNAATGEACRRFRLTAPTGPVDVIVRARDAAGAPGPGGFAVAEGEFVADVRTVA